METIFDHTPTRSELQTILGYIPDKDSYDTMYTDQNHQFGLVYMLYGLRNDQKTAQKYLGKITDRQVRAEFQHYDITV